MTTQSFALALLLYAVLPLWVAMGFCDWLCHRAVRIELTTGSKESMLHLLGLAEAGVAVIPGLFCDINSLVLIIITAMFIIHEATFYWDVKFASSLRTITPLEQRVHDYLCALGLVALSIVYIVHWPQLLAIFGAGPETPRYVLAAKEPALPLGYVIGLLSAVLCFGIIPFTQELWRGLRAERIKSNQVAI